jgi:UDP-N-acetylmuramate--alanine ligase
LKLGDIHTIYFLGIGGIGMSALARYFRGHGAEVYGYDRTETDLTRALEREGMHIHYDEDPRLIPAGVDLVVYTPAVPADHAGLVHFRHHGFPVIKRAEVLGIISRSKRTIAIGGTHGKTSTSSLTAHLVRAGGIDATAFVGGLALNLGGNFVEGTSDWVVAEADEYDRSFLHLQPEIAVINSIDPDHLDIYGSAEAVAEAYGQFAAQVKPGGTLLYKHGLALPVPATSVAAPTLSAEDSATEVAGTAGTWTFGIGAGDYQASNLRVEKGWSVFDLQTPRHGVLKGLRQRFPGRHNVENACAAIAAALTAGVPKGRIRAALAGFKGVKRRFEYIVRRPDLVFIDDYAHHPAELEATIQAARSLFPGRRLTGVFQPHLFSRTRDFADGFARALDGLDECLLLPIYPAREEPLPGITSELILQKMQLKSRRTVEKKELLDTLKEKDLDVLLTMGAGDIDTLVKPIKRMLNTATKQRTHSRP